MIYTSTQRDKLNAFFRSHTRVQYKKGEVIVRPEDEPNGVYMIEWGFVKACTTTKYGEENLLITRGAGGVFPLIWAYTGEHRQVSYETMEPTSLWRVSKPDYLDFLAKNPDVLPVLIIMAVDAYRLHSERVITLSYRTAKERVVSFLITNAKRFGVKNKDGTITINAPYRQSDIASSVNATRETTSRELNTLKKRNLIANDGHYIMIKDIDALNHLITN